jgi:hypothetical protein
MENEKDYLGRTWMHCESGLYLSKVCMGRFLVYCLENNILIGDIWALNPEYKRSLVCVAVCLRPEQIEDFTKVTGGKLRKPAVIKLNGPDWQ